MLEWIVNVMFRYGYLVVVFNGELFFFIDWVYCSLVNFFLYEFVEFRDDKMIEGGLCVGYLSEDGKYEMVVFGCNINNDELVVGGIDFNNLIGFVNEFLFFGVELKVKLN